ncbi:MAG: GtrA family protein [Thermoleophilaceae bacterium]|jgi:putative flippase GtrA
MQDDSAPTAAPVRTSPNGHSARTPEALAVHTRVRHGLRRPHNWIQLFKFFVVGGSGYVVNLAVFTLAVELAGVHHIGGATLGWIAGVTNNFWWNRHWTFGAKEGHAGWQAGRFFAVSVVAFLFGLGILQLLVDTGMNQEIAQTLSIIAATPLNFLGNKMWSFGSSVPARRS